ncbi:hypothetical protein OG528_29120 [Streptomyces platensis]|uniref:hypothetical protein n=1 Tax=Streptomyces platensis TaxID=58346 RepID=UPI0030DFA3CD
MARVWEAIVDVDVEWWAVLVSIVAGVIAIWQARLAKRQAAIAEGAAASAVVQARAAEEQVKIMRAQLAGEEFDRLEARRPKFTVEATSIRTERDTGNQHFYTEVVLTQTGGRPLSSLIVSASGEYVQGMRDGKESDSQLFPVARETTIEGMSEGSGPEKVYVHFEYRHAAPVRVTLTLKGVERGTGHVWDNEVRHVTVDREPQVPTRPYSDRRLRGRR